MVVVVEAWAASLVICGGVLGKYGACGRVVGVKRSSVVERYRGEKREERKEVLRLRVRRWIESKAK